MLPDEYSVGSLIHDSQNSRVYEVDGPNGERLAAKLPPLGSRTSAKRFQREIEALHRAAGPSTMPIVLADPDFGWYLMPRATMTLAQVATPTPIAFGLEILDVIAAALQGLHARGEVHRDLKPENILQLSADSGDRWVVSDFGIVRNAAGVTTAQITQAGSLLGTEWWAAPEQHRDAHDATPRADVYSAALVVAWLTTGVSPRDFRAVGLAEHPLAGPLARATAVRVDRRFADLDAFVEACQSALAATSDKPRMMVDEGRFDDLSDHLIKHPTDTHDAVDALASVPFAEIESWYRRSPDAAVDLFTRICDALHDDIGSLSFSNHVDPVLIHGVRLARLHYSNEASDGSELAESVLGAISGLHQFAPADHALDWLDTLPQVRQNEMRIALHVVDGWGFFAGMASGRFASRRRSRLVTDLANDRHPRD